MQRKMLNLLGTSQSETLSSLKTFTDSDGGSALGGYRCQI